MTNFVQQYVQPPSDLQTDEAAFSCESRKYWQEGEKEDWLQSASVELRGWRGENGCLRRRFVVISTIPLTVQAWCREEEMGTWKEGLSSYPQSLWPSPKLGVVHLIFTCRQYCEKWSNVLGSEVRGWWFSPPCSWLSGPWVHWGGDECSELFVVEEKLIGQHFHEVRHDINYMLLLCIFLFCTGLSLQSKPEQSLKEQQGDRGAARMARKRHWLLEFWQKSVQGSKKYLNWKKILQFFWSQVWWMVARRQTTWRVRCFIIFIIATTIYIVIM